jgi:quercetin dioxygenase-like cupin family protein
MSDATFQPRVLLHGDQSGSEISAIENGVLAGWPGPPLHRHDFDEAFYLLDGELTFQLGEDLVAAGAGELVFAPRGAPHTLANLSEAPARYLLLCTPAGFERHFARIEAEQAGIDPPAWSLEDVPEVVRVGPRIGERDDLTVAPVKELERGRINVLLRSQHSGDRVAVMDNLVPAGTEGPPLHHHDFDEAFYVVEGELTFQLGEEVAPRRAGELAFARRGAHHAFANLSGADARTLIVCTPAGFERYFDRMAARNAGVEPPAEALKPWPEVVIVGPRIGERAPEV